jgi:hypothetical protein
MILRLTTADENGVFFGIVRAQVVTCVRVLAILGVNFIFRGA